MQPARRKQEIDLRFLEGPRTRWKEFRSVVSIANEFIYGFRKLHFVGPCVTFFGSARFQEDHPYYEAAREMARRVGRVNFGRTSEQAKSGLGAVPVLMGVHVKLCSAVANTLAGPFIRKVKPSAFELRAPFRKAGLR